MTVHLLGIFNYATTSAFIARSKVDYTKDTHEIVLSDERIAIVGNNLDAEKLRAVVVKGITLTLPAAANTQAGAASLNLVFFDRHAGTRPSRIRQFANVLRAIGAPDSGTATALAGQHLKDYGISSLYLCLNVTPELCRRLFIDNTGQPYPWTSYLDHACAAQRIILNDDPGNADRLKLYSEGIPFWRQLENAGSPQSITQLLAAQGIRENARVDVVTVLWWSSAMSKYAKAVAAGQPLEGLGTELVQDATRGFNEPWLILALWNMLQNPAIESAFTCSGSKHAVAAG